MRPLLVEWLARTGVPSWLVPNYLMVAGMAGLAGSVLVLRLVRQEGAPMRVHAVALACGYVAAFAGGSLFEMLRALPAAWEAGTWAPVLGAGRAAYGGLLAGLVASALYVRSQREPVAAFLDRVSVGAGGAFFVGRVGCFLAGCDYGAPTASALGVRFPAESLAAVDHAQRGWVPVGAPSLPVHATQLYEAALGAVASLAAAWVLRSGRRDGSAFRMWLLVYAGGRFLNEFLRGDASRGLYVGLSTSQWVSVALLLACVLRGMWGQRRVARVAAAAVLVGVGSAVVPTRARAQDVPVLGTPAGAGDVEAPSGAASAQPSATVSRPDPRFGLRGSVFSSLSTRAEIPSGMGVDLDGTRWLRLSPSMRLELGLTARLLRNGVAVHYGLGPLAQAVMETGGALELTAALALPYTVMVFDSAFFPPVGRWGVRMEVGAQLVLAQGTRIGGTVLCASYLSSRATGPVRGWEPRLWLGHAF